MNKEANIAISKRFIDEDRSLIIEADMTISNRFIDEDGSLIITGGYENKIKVSLVINNEDADEIFSDFLNIGDKLKIIFTK